jgi:Flp pilus assembly protein CpaB
MGSFMTDNHNPDRALLNDLAAAVPQADPAFRDRLEMQLVEQLQRSVSEQEQEVETMHNMIAMHPRAAQEPTGARRRTPAPLTLAAALLMVVLAGSVLLMNRPSGAPDLFAAAQQQTPPPAAGENCPPPAGWDQRYTVQAGDTVLAVVIRFGVDARLFLAANCLDASSALSVGQVVYLPNAGAAQILPLVTATPILAVDALGGLEMTATAVIADATAQAQGMPQVVTATPILFPPTVVPPVEAYREVPSGFAPVIVAAQDIPRGTLVTDAMLAITYWPLEMFQAGTSFYSTAAQAVNRYASVDIPRFQPVEVASLLEQPPADAADGVINDGWIAVSIPQERVAASAALAPGDVVSVVATFMFVDTDTDTQGPGDAPATPRSVKQRVISGAEVIQLADNSNRPGEYLLAVPPHDAVILTWLVDAQVPLALEVFEG